MTLQEFTEYPEIRTDKLAISILKKAREFKEKYILPVAHEIDKKLLINHNYYPEEIIKRGAEFRFFSLPLPGILGGSGGGALHVSILLEELCSGCAGIANIFGAHYLGVAGVLVSGDISIYGRFLSKIVEGEKRGEPVIFSAAITEPTAGTDVEDRDLLPLAKLIFAAKKVEGGYLLNGRKVFISNGSIADYHLVVGALDRNKPLETLSGFVVPKDTRGFSVGRVEMKMGQRACPAAELIFEDCFVPEENRVGIEGEGMLAVELTLAASRAPVGAIATGIARGAYERALQYALNKKRNSGRLIDRQWVNLYLAEMEGMIRAARNAYIRAALFFDNSVMKKMISGIPQYKTFGYLLKRGLYRLTSSDSFKRRMVQLLKRRLADEGKYISLGLSSLAKFSCSDIAVRVCLLAMKIMGNEGCEERNLVEKYLRDAKLTQIYEGTNQLNRLEVYKRLVAGRVYE